MATAKKRELHWLRFTPNIRKLQILISVLTFDCWSLIYAAKSICLFSQVTRHLSKFFTPHLWCHFALQVKISCGSVNELVSVSEPSRCEYAMEFKTPAACQSADQMHREHEELWPAQRVNTNAFVADINRLLCVTFLILIKIYHQTHCLCSCFARPCLYLHPAAQLFQGAHVMVYRSDCRYLPYSIHFSEFMSISFTTE